MSSSFERPPSPAVIQENTSPAVAERQYSEPYPPARSYTGFGAIQPVSAEMATGPGAVLLPVPLSAEEAKAVNATAELTPPLVVGNAAQAPPSPFELAEPMPPMAGEVYAPVMEEGYVEESEVYPRGLLTGMMGKKHAKKEYHETLKAMGLKGKEAKHKHKERRDNGYNNPYIGRELRMKSHPMYVVEPPDVLYIEAKMLLPERPVMGERLVRQDGTIHLGYYGQIHVAGLTLFEIEQKIRERLSEYVQNPQVYVDVAAFNSKVYYVLGQVNQSGRLPITGKETVLDAITLAGGLTNFADISEIHVARPNPGGGCDQILWVDYRAIADCADTRTNYQLLPGDRVVVPGTKGFRTNVFFDNFLTPFERIASLGSLIRFSLD